MHSFCLKSQNGKIRSALLYLLCLGVNIMSVVTSLVFQLYLSVSSGFKILSGCVSFVPQVRSEADHRMRTFYGFQINSFTLSSQMAGGFFLFIFDTNKDYRCATSSFSLIDVKLSELQPSELSQNSCFIGAQSGCLVDNTGESLDVHIFLLHWPCQLPLKSIVDVVYELVLKKHISFNL